MHLRRLYTKPVEVSPPFGVACVNIRYVFSLDYKRKRKPKRKKKE